MAKANAPLGLEMQMFNVVVGKPEAGVPDAIQVIFIIDSEKVGQDADKAAEQAQFDQQFDEIAQSLMTDKKEEEQKAAPDDLREMLRRLNEGGGGFLGGASP